MKTAFITGAAKRIGRAVALHLGKSGYDVAVHVNQSVSAGEQLVEELLASGTNAYLVVGDLADENGCSKLVDDVRKKTDHVDVLVNSASTFTEDHALSFALTDLLNHMAVNAFAPLYLSRALVTHLSTRCIVNFLDSRVVDYDAAHASYHLSKRALDAITRMLAVELAPAVRVNAVAPGLILPPEGKGAEYVAMRKAEVPLGRQGTLDEICMAVDFLLHNGFVTGQTIFVDGGRHLKGAFYG